MLKHEDYFLKITVWLGKDWFCWSVWFGKTFEGFTKVNPISGYGELSGDAFANHITLSFLVFSETFPTFSDGQTRNLQDRSVELEFMEHVKFDYSLHIQKNFSHDIKGPLLLLPHPSTTEPPKSILMDQAPSAAVL